MSSSIHSNFNANRTKLNGYYKDNIDQLLGFDYSNIIEVIFGFLDDSLWGITKYNNIVCLEKGLYFRKIIHFIDKPLCERNNSPPSPSLKLFDKTNKNTINDYTYDIHKKYKHNKKKMSRLKYKNKNKQQRKDRRRKCQKEKYNYHSYFHNRPDFGDEIITHGSIRYDSSHDPYYCYFCNQYNLCEDEMHAESSYEENYDMFSLYWTD